MAHASDTDDVIAFLSRLSRETLRARYLSAMTNGVGPWAHRETQRLLNPDQLRHVVVLAEVAADIRGIGEFTIDASGHSADFAMTVEDTFQGLGIGQALFRHLECLAQERGVSQFTGHVAHGNGRVVSLLRRAGRPLRLQMEYGALHFTLGLAS
jgi:ribosomal protein S18 acetylase RimI-like enzyme